MSKFSGNIGFAISSETSPDVWSEAYVERHYTGDCWDTKMDISSGDGTNPNISLSKTIGIVMDAFLKEHVPDIRYVTMYGKKWKVNSFSDLYPEIRITIGGLYNG